ncbi:hypothetical protein FM042_06775 [Aliidiomarina halalkaliphila]|uniref:Uncharacterized protein n=1 Tax=Aliidiomarina halalkaliphila TaxID=2593535 RepID=A0A552X0Z4_9GAMM|nr:hypothetical protein [Aliidiomarina halalkaliphila]TRW48684.1 hypothetical protein FM042_06775 [Aliidiomarina halalkaliphila]
MRTIQHVLTQQRTPVLVGAFALLCLVPFALTANETATSEAAKQPPPFFFSDCSHLVFDSREGEELTRAERIAVLNADIEANLGKHEACMAAAAAAGQDRMSDAGATGGANGGSDTAQQTVQQSSPTQQAEDDPQEQRDQAQRDTADPSREHQGSERQTGSSAVCDAIKTGLDEATTESEKEHFEALAKEYGCRS